MYVVALAYEITRCKIYANENVRVIDMDYENIRSTKETDVRYACSFL